MQNVLSCQIQEILPPNKVRGMVPVPYVKCFDYELSDKGRVRKIKDKTPAKLYKDHLFIGNTAYSVKEALGKYGWK